MKSTERMTASIVQLLQECVRPLRWPLLTLECLCSRPADTAQAAQALDHRFRRQVGRSLGPKLRFARSGAFHEGPESADQRRATVGLLVAVKTMSLQGINVRPESLVVLSLDDEAVQQPGLAEDTDTTQSDNNTNERDEVGTVSLTCARRRQTAEPTSS